MTENIVIKSPQDLLVEAFCDVIDAAAAIGSEIRWFAPKVRQPLSYSIHEMSHLYDLSYSLHNLTILNTCSAKSFAKAGFLVDLLNNYKNKEHHRGFYAPTISHICDGIFGPNHQQYKKFVLFTTSQMLPTKTAPKTFHFYHKDSVEVRYQYTGSQELKDQNRIHLLNRLVETVKNFQVPSDNYYETIDQHESELIYALTMIIDLITRIASEIRLYSSYALKSEPLSSEVDFNELVALGNLIVLTSSITGPLRKKDTVLTYSTAKTIIEHLKPYLAMVTDNAFAKPSRLSSGFATLERINEKSVHIYTDNSNMPEFMKRALNNCGIGKTYIATVSKFETHACETNRIGMVTIAIEALNRIVNYNQNEIKPVF